MTIPLIILNGIIPETMITLRLFAISAKLNIIPYKGNKTKQFKILKTIVIMIVAMINPVIKDFVERLFLQMA